MEYSDKLIEIAKQHCFVLLVSDNTTTNPFLFVSCELLEKLQEIIPYLDILQGGSISDWSNYSFRNIERIYDDEKLAKIKQKLVAFSTFETEQLRCLKYSDIEDALSDKELLTALYLGYTLQGVIVTPILWKETNDGFKLEIK